MAAASEGDGKTAPLLERTASIEDWMSGSLRLRKMPTREDGELERRLNLMELTLLGIGACIGAGIFVLTGAEARVAGPSVALSFLLAAFSSVFNGLCYAELASRLPVSGSAYLYAYCMLGELPALILVINQLADYHIGAATLTRSLVAYVAQAFKDMGIPVHQCVVGCEPFEAAPWLSLSLGAPLVLGLLTFVVARGAETNALVTSVMTVVKILIVIFVIGVGSRKVDPDLWQPFFPFGVTATMSSAATLNYAFIGYDVIANAAEECRNPQRDIPAAMILALTTCATLYLGVSLVMCGMQDATTLDTEAPVSSAFLQQGMLWVASVVDVGSFAGMCTGLLAGLYGQSRIYFAVARDGLVPQVLQDAPRCAVWCGGLATILATFLNVKSLAPFLNIGVLLSYAVTAASVLLINACSRRTEWPLLLSVSGLAAALALLGGGGKGLRPPPWGIAPVALVGVILMVLVVTAHRLRSYECCPSYGFRCPGMPSTPLIALAANIYLATQLSGYAWIRLAVVSLIVVVVHSSAVFAGVLDAKPERRRRICKTVKNASTNAGTNPGLCRGVTQ